eukprot:m.254721 g.254721  ORF g.254721 m.254721 type:complete len:398 (-) comp17555_c0_seq17:21-1214(-)
MTLEAMSQVSNGLPTMTKHTFWLDLVPWNCFKALIASRLEWDHLLMLKDSSSTMQTRIERLEKSYLAWLSDPVSAIMTCQERRLQRRSLHALVLVRCYDSHLSDQLRLRLCQLAIALGCTAVFTALHQRYPTLFDPRSSPKHRLSTLAMAARYGRTTLVESIFNQYGLLLRDCRRHSVYILRMAARHGHEATLSMLFAKFNFSSRDIRSNVNYALRWACRNGHVKVVKLLLSQCSVMTQRDLACREYASLRHAIINSHVSVVTTLLARFPNTPIAALEEYDGQAVKHVIQTRDAAMLSVLCQHFGRQSVFSLYRRSLANRLVQGPCVHERKSPHDPELSLADDDADSQRLTGPANWQESPLDVADDEPSTLATDGRLTVDVLYPSQGARHAVARLSF